MVRQVPVPVGSGTRASLVGSFFRERDRENTCSDTVEERRMMYLKPYRKAMQNRNPVHIGQYDERISCMYVSELW